MKIMIVAMASSIHTARWIKQILDKNWHIYIFPSENIGVFHPNLIDNNIRIICPTLPTKYGLLRQQFNSSTNNINLLLKFTIYIKLIYPFLFSLYYKTKHKLSIVFFNHKVINARTNTSLVKKNEITSKMVYQLQKAINKYKPDIIHSLETQAAGYLVESVKSNFDGSFPIWIHTNWGSDIYLFGRLKNHLTSIQRVLKNCDYYTCECNRDVQLAIEYGYKGKIFPVFPNSGGFNLATLSDIRSKTITSSRKVIMLKGYQGWAGRSLVGLRSLSRLKYQLKGYEVIIYSNPDGVDVAIAAELLSNEAEIPVSILSANTSHEEILEYHAKARISIGLSISDSISTSLLEAMVMGSFPIQSWTSAANEWIIDGKTGLLVPPEDPEIIEQAIRRALTDDRLVDEAAKLNWQIAQERLDYEIIKNKTVELYEFVFNDSKAYK